MEVRGNPRSSVSQQVTYDSLKIKQQQWVDYSALDFLVVDPKKGDMKQLTIVEVANTIGVNPDTLYEWRRTIPNFWQLVAERRATLGSQTRLAKVHHSWYLKALGGSWPHMEAYLRNFDETFKEPKQKHELEIKHSVSDLLKAAKDDGIIEGEVISGTDYAGTNGEDADALSLPS